MEKIKILVVDDESRMRKLVKDFLGREGYQVLEAGDGLDLFHIINLPVRTVHSDFLFLTLRRE